MKTIVFLSLLEMYAYVVSYWAHISSLAPTVRLPVVELVYIGDGYQLLITRCDHDI
ncbi:MAG: hypothetical protein ACXABY_28400 [Candidatus Thorarchaeota archaeon]|jgi:hypothetical protein